MKNQTAGHTDSFKRMRAREIEFVTKTPFYGSDVAERMYNTLKKHHNILQVGVCGPIVSVVHYKQDADTMRTYLHKMFPGETIKQKTSDLTELVTTFTIRKAA